MEDKKYKSVYLLRVLQKEYNPFRPNIIVLNDHFIEYSKRNWYLISKDTQTFHFSNVVGITVNKHILGATLKIMTYANSHIYISGFSQHTADTIKKFCLQYIAKNTQRSMIEVLSNAITSAAGRQNASNTVSKADELKKLNELLELGIITRKEFAIEKSKLLNS